MFHPGEDNRLTYMDHIIKPNIFRIIRSRYSNLAGMGEQEIINALKLANNNELQYLQEKVDYLRNQLNMLEPQNCSYLDITYI